MPKVYDDKADKRDAPISDNSVSGNQTSPGNASYDRGDSVPGRDRLRNAEEKGGFYNNQAGNNTGAGGATNSTGSPPGNVESPEGLNDSETGAGGPASDQFASGFGQAGKKKGLRSSVMNNRSLMLKIGAVLGGGIISIMIAVLTFIPLKIESFVNNLQARFFAAPTQAITAMTQTLAKDYIVRYVVPELKNCGTTINRNCKVRISAVSNNPVIGLYRTWSNQHLEYKLATKYHIEFEYNPHSRVMKIKYPGGPSDGTDIGPNGEKLELVLNSPDTKDVKRALNTALDKENKITQAYYRFKVGPLLRQKDGFTRCIFFCGTRKAIKEPIEDAKDSAKLYLAEKVLKPRREMEFVAIKCILTPSCEPEKTTVQPCTAGEDCELNSRPESDVEREERATLEALAAEEGVTDLAKARTTYKEMSDRGFQRYLTDQVLQKVFSVETSQKITDSVPYIGWINLAAELVNNANDASAKIKKLGYIVAAAAAVKVYMEYRTYADEIHTGQVDPNQVGSMVDSLGTGDDNTNDPLVGGTASAEQSPIYQAMANISPTTGNSGNYICKNGKPPPPGKLICSEEVFGQTNGIASALHDFVNSPSLAPITALAQVWRDTFGQVFDLANAVSGGAISVLFQPLLFTLDHGCGIKFLPDYLQPANSLFPGYCVAKNLVTDAAPKIVDGITNYLLPNAWGTNMGGGRRVQLMAAGAKAAGGDSCTDQLGCEDASDAAAADIINQQQADARDEFSKQPLFARLFDTSNSYSLVSKMAMATPFDVQASAQNGFASILSNPFGSLMHGFGTAVVSKPVSAQVPTSLVDPWHMGNKIFPVNKMPAHPSDYWDANNCGDTSSNGPVAKWQQAAADGPVNPDTGMPVHRDVEPCLLIQQTVGVAGGVNNTSLLSQDDLAEANLGNNSNNSGSSTDQTQASGDAQQTAKQIQQAAKDGKITFNILDVRDSADHSTPADNIQQTADGEPAKTTSICALSGRGAQAPTQSVKLDPDLLSFILDLSKQTPISINALAGQCHHSSSSNHYKGKAVDFGCPFNQAVADEVGKKYNISDQTGEYCSNTQHYHYSIGGH